MVYDVTDPTSLRAIDTWREEAIKFCPENVSLILLGNKCDAVERKITKEEGKEMANKYNMIFLETSAKTGNNINDAFQMLTKEIKTKIAISKKSSEYNGKSEKGKKLGKVEDITNGQKKKCC